MRRKTKVKDGHVYLSLTLPLSPPVSISGMDNARKKRAFHSISKGYALVGDYATLNVYCFDPDTVYDLRPRVFSILSCCAPVAILFSPSLISSFSCGVGKTSGSCLVE